MATSPAGAGPSQSGAGHPETIRFPIDGMTCGSCVVRITRALKRVDGVSHVRVDLGREIAVVRRIPRIAPDAALAAAVAGAGYEANLDDAVAVDASEADGLVARILRRRR